MSNPSQQLRLIREHLAADDGAGRWAGAVDVPAWPAYLIARPGTAPTLEPIGHAADGGAGHGPTNAANAANAAAAVAAALGPQPRVVVACLGGRVRVDGVVAPLVAVVRPGDVLELDGDPDHHLHATVYHRPQIGPAGPELAGAECAVCRVPFDADTVVYRCPCGSAFHCEPAEVGPDALQCAQMASACPHCGRPPVMTEGYSFVPEGYPAHEPEPTA